MLFRSETITENLDNSGFNVESLCASQNMSRSSFYNKLKALTDQAPADYIRLDVYKRQDNADTRTTFELWKFRFKLRAEIRTLQIVDRTHKRCV